MPRGRSTRTRPHLVARKLTGLRNKAVAVRRQGSHVAILVELGEDGGLDSVMSRPRVQRQGELSRCRP